MASVPVMVQDLLRPRVRDILGGERVIPYDRVQTITTMQKMSTVDKVRELTIDLNRERPGKFIPFKVVPQIEKKKRKKPRAETRKSAKAKTTSDGGLLSGAFERTPENAFTRSASDSPDKKGGVKKSSKLALRSAKPPSSAKPTPEKPKPVSLRSAPIVPRSAPKPAVDKAKSAGDKAKSAVDKAKPAVDKAKPVVDKVEPREPREKKSGSSKKGPPPRSKREPSNELDERSPKKPKPSSSKRDEARASRHSDKGEGSKGESSKGKKKKSSSSQEDEDRSKKTSRRDERKEGSPVKKKRSSSSQDSEEKSKKTSSRRDSTSETGRKESKTARPSTSTPRAGEASASLVADKLKSEKKEVKAPRLISMPLRSARPPPTVSTPDNANTPIQTTNGGTATHAGGTSAALAAGSSLKTPEGRRLPRESDLSIRFTALKKQAKELWEAKDYDRYETVSREAVKVCFEWALAKEEDLRRREGEMRRTPKLRDSTKLDIRNQYLYIAKRFVPEAITQLTSIGRKALIPAFQKVIHKCYLRMFALTTMYVPEDVRVASVKAKVAAALASMGRAAENGKPQSEAKVSMSASELRHLQTFLIEFSNLFKICDSLASGTAGEPEEPGTECYVQ